MDINGYENYVIYEDGRCLSKARNKTHNTKSISNEMFLKPRKRRDYYCYMLYSNGNAKAFDIHRLVALHYIPNPNNFRVVNHIDCDKNNNDKSNLEWCSDMYNGQSFNKSNLVNRGTIVVRNGVRRDTFRGTIRIMGKYYYTKSVWTREEAQELIFEIIKNEENADEK
jgi:hypothetical protein